MCSGCGFKRQARSVDYVVRLGNLDLHEVHIAATFAGIQPGEPFEILMSRASPGTYRLHDFIKYVHDVHVIDSKGGRLDFEMPDPYRWLVPKHDGTVTISYTLFGDQADGTFNGIERDFVHLNVPASFVWSGSMTDVPIYLHVQPPQDSWDVATQLSLANTPFSFRAPNWESFLDSPVRMGPMSWYSKSFGAPDSVQHIRLAIQHQGATSLAELWSEKLWKVVEAQIRVFGELPRYENGEYTFMAAFQPNVRTDGIAHRNSSVITCNCTLEDEGAALLRRFSHEFFHQWNLERIRPKDLEPFNLQAAPMTDVLWFVEGFTRYYQDLSIRRAGITSNEQYAKEISDAVNAIRYSREKKEQSLLEISERALFEENSPSNNVAKLNNAPLSFEKWGSVVALMLDLQLRADFDTSLDTFMQTMWQRFGSTGQPYSFQDVQQTLVDVTEDPWFAQSFFERYVYNKRAPYVGKLLSRYGFILRSTFRNKRFTGGTLEETADGLLVSAVPIEGSPFWNAGIDFGDLVLSVNGTAITTDEQWEDLLLNSTVGQPWEVVFISQDKVLKRRVDYSPDQTVEVLTLEETGEMPNEEVLIERQKWLGM